MVSDEGLLNPGRLWRAFKMWFYLVAVMEAEAGFWYIMRFYRRSAAEDRYRHTTPRNLN